MAYFGPFTENINRMSSTGGYVSIRSRYRQKPPYNDRLPYVLQRFDTKTISNPWGLTSGNTITDTSGVTSADTDAASKAYSQFTEAAKDVSVNIAVDIAERRQSIDMIARRASQLYRFSRQVAHFDFIGASKTLGLKVRRVSTSGAITRLKVRKEGKDHSLTLKRGLNTFGNNYLEYHFGWEPLVKDINDALELSTSSNFKGLRKTCRGRGTTSRSGPPPPPSLNAYQQGSTTWYPLSRVQIIGDVTVDNPNLLLLNQTGFINPAVVLWELVPFSFVVDWFSTVGQVLQSYTDFIGLSVTNAATTIKNKKVFTQYLRDYVGGSLKTLPHTEKSVTYVARTLGVYKPVFAVKRIKLPSVTRAATAISLLSQFLGTHR